MIALILGFAQDRDDIRAVVMTGSRANTEASRDRFQDYDISYLVEDVASYRTDPQLPSYFGEIMILQTPDDMGFQPPAHNSYAYLMQFTDGNRIDLTIRPVSDIGPIIRDSLSMVLLDKDRRFSLPPPSLRSYLPQKPTAKEFADCCNEFWWVTPYVAKGLYRDQIPYAKAMLDGPMRSELLRMLAWYVGVATNFQVSVGLGGKHLKKRLPAPLWQVLESTWSDAHAQHTWQALFAMNELFRITAKTTADVFHFAYPDKEDCAVSRFIREIQALPPPNHLK